jgi:hypothetical protein
MPAASVRAIGYSVRLPVTTPAALARSLAREAREADSWTNRNVPVTPMTPVKTPKMMARSRGFEPDEIGWTHAHAAPTMLPRKPIPATIVAAKPRNDSTVTERFLRHDLARNDVDGHGVTGHDLDIEGADVRVAVARVGDDRPDRRRAETARSGRSRDSRGPAAGIANRGDRLVDDSHVVVAAASLPSASSASTTSVTCSVS